MANECSICGDRRIETCMLVLNNGTNWVEFCACCADAVCLVSPEGERKTPREVWDAIPGATPCGFPVLERHEPPVRPEDDFDFDAFEEDCVSPWRSRIPAEIQDPEDALEDRETLAELPSRFERSTSFNVAWVRDGFIRAKGPKGRGWKKPRNRLQDKRQRAA